ncbi:NAD-dependent protein deacetylase hst4 [Neolecta irregularis DAH-3]|uniref:NAD-dependent protein deacetylase hst4 n=1 Tax=Neolecta irregularis (strain DAH-3) TaxID=1198029 RepID=A0A1U7LT49_NEOID|nr:NAD-dependent protein deacetylase hst4 [Neolecta irregularis DAH-3]|eukprot:OLL25824.1 NAD-dependent protein deacetylase hst4 [Neolecta irregularis DAH-3]
MPKPWIAKRQKFKKYWSRCSFLSKTLDLTSPVVDQQALQTFRDIMTCSNRILVIAGAGVSVASGIPDFRSNNGLFASLRTELKIANGKDMFDSSVYTTKEALRKFHRVMSGMQSLCKNSQSTSFHSYMSFLSSSGRLLRLYTQNIDCLESQVPDLKTEIPLPQKGPWPRTIRLHGGLDHVVCALCHTVAPFQDGLFVDHEAPDCERCLETDQVRRIAEKRQHGIGKLRPRVVLYHEENPDADAIGTVSTADLRARPDALVVVGTSLKVPGVQRLVKEFSKAVKHAKGLVIWINKDDPPINRGFENVWDLTVKGDCQNAIELLREDSEDGSDSTEGSSSRSSPVVLSPATPPSTASTLTLPHLSDLFPGYFEERIYQLYPEGPYLSGPFQPFQSLPLTTSSYGFRIVPTITYPSSSGIELTLPSIQQEQITVPKARKRRKAVKSEGCDISTHFKGTKLKPNNKKRKWTVPTLSSRDNMELV